MLKWLPVLLAAILLLTGCDQSVPGDEPKLTLALNWKPEPQFGGFYAAEPAFRQAGLDVTILPGGSGTPTVQMVAAGQVDFAVVSADEVLISRSKGSDVVALFAVYQTNPQGLMTHASRNLTDIGQIFVPPANSPPGTLAIQAGLPYANYLKNKYGFDKVTVVPNTAGLPTFLRDPQMTLQCFVTSEPLSAKKLGVDTKTFLVAEAGYNPYTTVVVTRASLIKQKPELVQKFTAAVKAGWQAYLDNPAPTNTHMQTLNPAMDAETFAASAEAQKPLILTPDTPLGAMSLARWEELGKQLQQLGVLSEPPNAADCFLPLPK